MAEIFRFLNSVNGDRRYLAEEFADYFHHFLTNGVYHTDFKPTLPVTAEGSDMTVQVGVGSALINGYMYKNTTVKPLVIERADAINDRIDRVVIRLNRNQDARNITAQIVKGNPSGIPTPPVLTRNNFIYEISLAQVYVSKTSIFVSNGSITDEREDSSVCGLVRSLITEQFFLVRDDRDYSEYKMGVENGLLYIMEV